MKKYAEYYLFKYLERPKQRDVGTELVNITYFVVYSNSPCCIFMNCMIINFITYDRNLESGKII